MISPLHVPRIIRGMLVFLAMVTLTLLYGCDYIASALPPNPSPYPTMARLPSVTPVTTSPTPQTTPTSRPQPSATPTLPPVLEGTVVIGANIRNGPGTDFATITSIVADSTVTLIGQSGGWYKIETADGTEGWMSEQVLQVPPGVTAALPIVEAPAETPEE